LNIILFRPTLNIVGEESLFRWLARSLIYAARTVSRNLDTSLFNKTDVLFRLLADASTISAERPVTDAAAVTPEMF